MKKPIIFNTWSIKHILEQGKWQTRRLVTPQPVLGKHWKHGWIVDPEAMDVPIAYCPYGQPSDQLWVRETWALVKKQWHSCGGLDGEEANYFWTVKEGPVSVDDLRNGWLLTYKAEGSPLDYDMVWRPSIHMPRWASRLTLTVDEVRVERLQDITHEDIEAEGIPKSLCMYQDEDGYKDFGVEEHYYLFREIWNNIHGKRQTRKCDLKKWPNTILPYTWEMNPWVWVIDFSL